MSRLVLNKRNTNRPTKLTFHTKDMNSYTLQQAEPSTAAKPNSEKRNQMVNLQQRRNHDAHMCTTLALLHF